MRPVPSWAQQPLTYDLSDPEYRLSVMQNVIRSEHFSPTLKHSLLTLLALADRQGIIRLPRRSLLRAFGLGPLSKASLTARLRQLRRFSLLAVIDDRAGQPLWHRLNVDRLRTMRVN